MKLTFTALVIDNDNGLSVDLFATWEAAQDALYQYVKDNWLDVFYNTETAPPLPTDKQEAIELYFNADNCNERAEISYVDVPVMPRV